jgi:hypothetical protein
MLASIHISLLCLFTYARRTIANQLSVECENIVGAGNHLVKNESKQCWQT